MYFTDLHVQLLSRGILNPGEQLQSSTVTFYRPWWALGFIQRQHLIMATDQRVILVDHRIQFFPFSQKLHSVESIPWSQVNELKVSGIFSKKIRVKGQGDQGPANHKYKISNALFGLFAMKSNNLAGARAIAQSFEQNKLGGAPQLGAPQSYGAPQLPPVSYGAPQINAPGYHSVPPPAPQQAYGAPPMQPMAGPFDPPRQY